MVEEIRTGVDKLVDLVKFKKKIGFSEAAQELGVSRKVIEDWADFLEDEKILSVEYLLLKPFLVEQKMSRSEVRRRTREFTIKKEAFLRKVESTLKNLDRDDVTIQKFRNSFYNLKKQVSGEIEEIKGHLAELEKYEAMKRDLDDKLLQVKSDFEKHSHDIDDELRKELRDYSKLLKILGSSHVKDKKKVQHLAEHEKLKIAELVDSTMKKERAIKDKEKLILAALETRKHSATTSKAKQEIIQKFQSFFDKKNKVNTLLQEITFEKDELKAEMRKLLEQSRSIEMKETYENDLKEFNERFERLEQKRKVMKNDMLKLDKML
ncbi:hypothetical protein JW968_01225 [Candidatus Woesearchaeota archaeon]|nr:hypothetical protein [Candidatus Woesearchaeota archaeon]